MAFSVIYAQYHEKGDKILNLGLGIGNNFTARGDDFSNSIPPLSASFEYIVNDELFDGKGAIGVGGFAQYMNYNYKVEYLNSINDESYNMGFKSALAGASDEDWKYQKFIVGPRGYLHYSFIDALDTYTGVMIGLDFVSWGRENSNNSHTGLFWSWILGGRYYFNDNLAAMLELGYSATYLNIGVAYKF
jgi:hypothetical protein